MKRFVPLLVFLLVAAPFKGEAEEIIKKGESLNLERCIEIALKKQPNIVAAQNTANAIQFRIGEAQANYYPQLSGTGGYSRISPTGQTASTTGGAFDQYTAGFALSQNIYDFGRTSSQVKISNLNYSSSLSDLENTTVQTTFNVKQTYFGVLHAGRNREVAIETVKQNELHLEQAKGFYKVGTKPKYDVTTAEVNLSNAKLNLIKAENALRIAFVNLNNAMGVPDAPEYAIEDILSFQKYEITLDDALTRAFQNRPDLQSVIVKRQSAEVSIDFAKSNYYPFLTGNASYRWAGESLDSLDHGWTVGGTVTFPIFSGFLTKNQVAELKANLNVLKANEESLRQIIILDVQQAYLNLKAAGDAIPTAELTVRQAQENLDIANGRYAAGVGSPIEVTDAEVSLTNAKTSYNQALYDYKVSLASLEKAIGMR